MCMPYQNAADANQHLQGTVVMFDNRPVYVHEVFGTPEGISATLRFLPRMNDGISVSVFDPRFEAKELGSRLGYLNIGDRYGALYVRRIPARQYKQGLVRGNVMIGGDARTGAVYGFNDAIRHGAWVDMMTRVYPSFDQALQMMKDNPALPSVAFSPELALIRQDLGFYLLAYKGEQIAWGDPKAFKLPSQFMYLKETLNKYGVPYDA